MLSDQIIIGPKLEKCFRRRDPEVIFVLAVFYLSTAVFALVLIKLGLHAVGIPSLGFVWELIMSLCA